jgi:hypothetical protein
MAYQDALGLTYNDPNSMYVPLPVQEFVQAGQMMNETYEKNQESFDKLSIAASQMELAPGDEYLRHSALTNLRELRDTIATQKGGFFGSGEIIRKRTLDLVTDPKLMRAQKNAAAIKQFREAAANMEAKGGTILNKDIYLNFTTESEDGKLRDFMATPDLRLNWEESKDKSMAGIAHSQEIQAATGLSGDQIAQAFTTATGVSEQKLAQVSLAVVDSYLRTPEGAQELRERTKEYGGDQEAAMKFIQGDLINRGYKQLSVKYDFHNNGSGGSGSTKGGNKSAVPGVQQSYLFGAGDKKKSAPMVMSPDVADWMMEVKGMKNTLNAMPSDINHTQNIYIDPNDKTRMDYTNTEEFLSEEFGSMDEMRWTPMGVTVDPDTGKIAMIYNVQGQSKGGDRKTLEVVQMDEAANKNFGYTEGLHNLTKKALGRGGYQLPQSGNPNSVLAAGAKIVDVNDVAGDRIFTLRVGADQKEVKLSETALQSELVNIFMNNLAHRVK